MSIAQGDPAQARLHLARAQETASLLTYALPWLAVQCRLQLGLAHLALADAAEVRTLLLEIDDIHTPSPRDRNQSMTWQPQEVWTFFTQF